ncbi:1-acyl-sn-glycerol-3-phosphate acyltransferase [Capsicum baccatum]|uniref:1-acyl-sn-glycerol-3-phosphate acyltransferase n=1 Tax=Capsicum baccatum TaxID=33114 RepID=A0A2G2WF98_CAPBA|nr:1-acyl-sn-glycerol-3-phosphate acyltransferase [Capsicum baccatum]
MESASLASGFLKNRRFGSYFDASSGSVVDSDRPREVVVANEKREELYGDDDGWVIMLISWIRMLICVVMWILGNPITIEGLEYSEETAIYISNHASLIDIFLIMWLTPTGTVGVAKKEIIWYLFTGQLYVLANHLRIDRSNPAAAIESMKEGFVHLALQTQRPVVPIVMINTHLAWRKGSLHVRPAPLTVKFLPPIRTDDWTADKIEDYVKMVHDVYVKNLPQNQKPTRLR